MEIASSCLEGKKRKSESREREERRALCWDMVKSEEICWNSLRSCLKNNTVGKIPLAVC
jgi:hypothetical protein